MVLPQFSLRMALGLMAVLGFVSLVLSRGLQGSPWAMGVSVALFALFCAFLGYAAVFGVVYMVSKLWRGRAIPGRPKDSSVGGTAAPREHADLIPPAAEFT